MKLLVTGDYFPTKHVEDFIDSNQENIEEIFGDLLPIIRNTDYSFVNIEYPITKSITVNKTKKYGPIRKGSERCLEPITKAGFTHACLANNHINNFGYDGIIDTIEACRRNQLIPTGLTLAGSKNYDVCLLDKDNYMIAVINVCENEFSAAIGSDPGGNPYNLVALGNLARHNACCADAYVLIVHGGTEWTHYPSPRVVADYRHLIDNGYSVIVSHHTHVFSGYEKHANGYIVYGLGNLITYRDWNHGNIAYIGQAVEIEIGFDCETAINLIPYYFDKQISRILCNQKEHLAYYYKEVSEVNSSLTDISVLENRWEESFSHETISSYMRIFQRIPYIVFRLFKKANLLPLLDRLLFFFMKKNGVNAALWNVMRCETHRDALEYLYKKYYLKMKKV